jgi:baculoviral IAP repeat-containing protein 6
MILIPSYVGEGDLNVIVEGENLFRVTSKCNDDFVQKTVNEVNMWLINSTPSVIELIAYIYSTAVRLLKDTEGCVDGTLDDELYEDDGTIHTVGLDAEWMRTNNLIKRFEQREQIMRETQSQLPCASPSTCRDKDKIFSSSASSLCLRNELISLINDSHELGYDIEAIDDDIYNWRVRMFRFDPDSDLYIDMTMVYDKYQYSYVEFQLRFAIDKFPFYPPSVTIIRPRFLGFMPGKIANLEDLRPWHWDAVNGIRSVLLRIRHEFEHSGRIDLDTSGNDPCNGEVAYLPIENVLLKLGQATETSSRIRPQALTNETKLTNDSFDKSKRIKLETHIDSSNEAAVSGKEFWAKGTGYGHNGRTSNKWTPEQYQAIREEKNKNEVELSSQLFDILAKDLANETQERFDPLHAAKTLEVLQESCLVPLISKYFKASTLLEMERSQALSINYFKVLHLIASSPFYRQMLPNMYSSEEESLEELSKGLYQRLTRIKHTEVPSAPNDRIHFIDTTEGIVMPAGGIDEYVRGVLGCVLEASRLQASEWGQPSQTPSIVTTAPTALNNDQSVETAYSALMRPLQFEQIPELSAFHYLNSLRGESGSGHKTRRLRKELSDLSESLPLSWSSSVWVRLMESRMDAMQVMISGPEGTPYSNGLFLFDVFFPDSYPSEPPTINLQTTGKGSVRFNPNLYNCGKVCLSLLGTWRGDASESWSEITSTFLQVKQR